ncbi:hypothetical protein [Pseudovibrio sp. Ad37]|uniref:hypothetical protein n=1 Tax=Pseudovibrio sp. Ad37 TaxID=989422 RepID=UPI0007B1F8D7|nr:hypothetical protein [Pseudovibrio sp. Ad37]KZL27001.1 AIPR protein [Pseudovibrio sp. Ad37]
MRSDAFKPTEKSFDLSEATIALACVSGDVSLAVQAKREIGKFYESLSKAPYRTIFNPKVSGVFVWNSVRALRFIEAIISGEISKLEKKSGKEYGLLVHGNRIIALMAMKDSGVQQLARDYAYCVDEQRLSGSVMLSIQKINSFIHEKYPEKVLGTLFKNVSICKELYQHCMEH